jgi:hypothetical protein
MKKPEKEGKKKEDLEVRSNSIKREVINHLTSMD